MKNNEPPRKEYYVRLNDTRFIPYRGERILLFRESTYWFELEIYKCNLFGIEAWREFCDQNKILYWCYLDKLDYLIPRPMKRCKDEWYTPDLPLFGE